LVLAGRLQKVFKESKHIDELVIMTSAGSESGYGRL